MDRFGLGRIRQDWRGLDRVDRLDGVDGLDSLGTLNRLDRLDKLDRLGQARLDQIRSDQIDR